MGFNGFKLMVLVYVLVVFLFLRTFVVVFLKHLSCPHLTMCFLFRWVTDHQRHSSWNWNATRADDSRCEARNNQGSTENKVLQSVSLFLIHISTNNII